ncbi:carboxylesterase [Plectosphaerella plurivora]|uniref:Carboxylic ester hydrolase n=1 Tax=Plectosphaerella plurivora TaxID=936078 RepID=A0A9P8V4V7_9PEZI|nr:carboxylesterase [Plectosphaerella plurivora]
MNRFLLACSLILGLGGVAAGSPPDLLARLDYGSFQGAYSEEFNISYWQKIPWAAPPIGENRFRGPQPPVALPLDEPYNSSQTFDMCPQRTVNGSEDCLYLGLYSRPWTRDQPLKPVIVVFYGGGFAQGSASFVLPPSGFPFNGLTPPSDMIFGYPTLNVSSASDMLLVYANYRTNSLGFLPGKEIAQDPHSDLNPGLLDQEAVLKWTKKNIAQFGGDPDDVGIWGQSAGGGSVIAQTIARGGQQKLFTRAMANSPFWPKTYRFDSPEAQAQYDRFASLTGCSGPDSLACLKQVDIQKIRDATQVILNANKYAASYFNWAPVIDGDFLQETLSEATAAGKLNTRVAFAMHNTHEGESFLPSGLRSATNTGSPAFNSSEASFDKWLRGFLPEFSECEIAAVKRHYPAKGVTETISYDTTWVRAGLIFRDTTLSCPAFWLVNAAPDGGYIGEYSKEPSLHASDTFWWNRINATQQAQTLYWKGYAGAIASFHMTGNPNTFKLTSSDVAGVPSVRDGEEWVISDDGFSTTPSLHLKQRCDFWRKVSPRMPV